MTKNKNNKKLFWTTIETVKLQNICRKYVDTQPRGNVQDRSKLIKYFLELITDLCIHTLYTNTHQCMCQGNAQKHPQTVLLYIVLI